MSEFYDIINLGHEGSKILEQKYTKEELKNLLVELNALDESNNRAFDKLISNEKKSASFSELTTVWQTKDKLYKLKEIINETINRQEQASMQNSLVILNDANTLAINEHIVIPVQELQSVQEDVDLGTGIDTDKQFFYNCKQADIDVTHQLSFEVEMFFEPLAPLPLRLGHKSHPLNQDLSFELSF